jgi:hypothetical protein
MLVGSASPDEFLAHAATMTGFDTDAVTLPDAEVFQAIFEMHIGGRETSLPPSLHPTAVPTFIAQVWRCPESPWGPFSLAQGRVGARSGLRPRGHVQGCVCDNEAVVAELGARWGLPVRHGGVHLRHHYDAVEAAVDTDGHTVLSVRGSDPEPIGAGDVQYSVSVALAHTPRGLRLVQVEADVAVTRAERVRPHLESFDAVGLGVHRTAQPYYPVSASIALGAITLQPLRFVCRPDELAFSGTEPV